MSHRLLVANNRKVAKNYLQKCLVDGTLYKDPACAKANLTLVQECRPGEDDDEGKEGGEYEEDIEEGHQVNSPHDSCHHHPPLPHRPLHHHNPHHQTQGQFTL